MSFSAVWEIARNAAIDTGVLVSLFSLVSNQLEFDIS